jgi:hypothetical protein
MQVIAVELVVSAAIGFVSANLQFLLSWPSESFFTTSREAIPAETPGCEQAAAARIGFVFHFLRGRGAV